MIVGTMEQLHTCKSLGEHFPAAIEYAKSLAWKTLQCGVHTIEKDQIFVNVMEYKTARASDKKLEAHATYADIQIIIEGTEAMECCPAQGLDVAIPYDVEKDILLYEDPKSEVSRIVLGTGMFALFMPEDAHKPGIDAVEGISKGVRKAVIKVRIVSCEGDDAT